VKQTWICQQITTRQEYYSCVDIVSNSSVPLFNSRFPRIVLVAQLIPAQLSVVYNVHAHAVAMWRSQLETPVSPAYLSQYGSKH